MKDRLYKRLKRLKHRIKNYNMCAESPLLLLFPGAIENPLQTSYQEEITVFSSIDTV